MIKWVLDLTSTGEQRRKERTGTTGGRRHGHYRQFYILAVPRVMTLNFDLIGNNSAIFTFKEKKNVFW